ncbi:glycosyltransferase [Polymorphobacter fuscus]|uniref:Glycosyltransferase n=1 Tax=Sandarakinorhabdus fusca TaxID=1439888 RepID=A0A7C9GQ43_9SPHN|nr:glycosyltransferase [Polymorphobacter fuscus]KAB7647928.1 glycosyltransferase family 4 protein [Polymorphobacter fuscus]MQT17250.1 hypothetical protein [Polymorphobacter fuscus]NJC08755.1 hypothetical protein [Polymorphobacter fuscus]
MTRHLAYFVHDLGDAAVARRVRMIHAGGLRVTVIGFHRHGTPPAFIDGAPTLDLGATADGRLLQRAGAVLRTLLRFRPVAAAMDDCDMVMARNLEMLVLANRGRGGRRLVYECLDIHGLLLGNSLASRLIQRIERNLLRRVDLVITSSSRFIDEYFHRRRSTSVPLLLVENKVLALTGRAPVIGEAPPAPPWVIGWFGMLRCRRSLRMLIEMVRRSGGGIELVLAGVPAVRELGDLFEVAKTVPGIHVSGAYGPDDLSSLYSRVHFAWAIDYFEEGLNSAWLMPNRLYEALAHGAVPIALGEVETGAWLQRHAVGLVVDTADNVPALLDRLQPADFAVLRARVAQLPRSAVVVGPAACHALAAAIADEQQPVAVAA